LKNSQLQGFLLIKKPAGITSSACVQMIKHKIHGKVKIGHTGTLDTYATGLLIIAINRMATQHIGAFMKLDKSYIATSKMGQLTDSFDLNGEVVSETEWKHVTKDHLDEALAAFGTCYVQRPPIFSALKWGGVRVSELARSESKSAQELTMIVSSKEKLIHLYDKQLLEVTLPFFTIKAHVSHGTYIRAFINDLAQKVGTYATVHQLKRTHIGPFLLDEAVELHDLKNEEAIAKNIILIDTMMQRLKIYLPPKI